MAGIADREEGIEDLARREAMEEANCKVTDLFEMFRYLPSPGMTNEVLIFFCGRMDSNQAAGVHGLASEHEDIRSALYDVAQIPELLAHGSTGNGPLITTLQWMLLNHDRVRAMWK